MKIALTPLALLACLLQGCGVAVVGAGSAAAITALEDRRTSGTQIEDEGIELRAGNRISERFGGKAHVSVTAFNRWVLVTGEVPDEAAKREIEKIVLAVPNVRGAANELQVAGASTLGSRTNDAYITSKVKARFVEARKFNAVHVKVVTEAAAVFLLGVVTAREAEDAVQLARTTGGVRKVVKIFEYCKTTDEVCRPRSNPPAAQPKPAA